MDAHPNSSFDITPGTEMYFDFSQNPKEWNTFFEKYSDQIVLGTDNWNPQWKERINGMTEFLETTRSDIPFFGKTIHGIGLSEKALNKIYRENFLKFIEHKRPKSVNMELVEEEFELVRKMAFRSEHKSVILHELKELREMF